MSKHVSAPRATLVNELPHWGAPASLYHVSARLKGFEYIVVAEIGWRNGDYHRGRPKLRIFGCERNGDINTICELADPVPVWWGHARALARCGYHRQKPVR
jgi:hypothetical protein